MSLMMVSNPASTLSTYLVADLTSLPSRGERVAREVVVRFGEEVGRPTVSDVDGVSVHLAVVV